MHVLESLAIGAAKVLQGIELEGEAEYLQPYGARRALGTELYEKGHSELSQSHDLESHPDSGATSERFQQLKAVRDAMLDNAPAIDRPSSEGPL